MTKAGNYEMTASESAELNSLNFIRLSWIEFMYVRRSTNVLLY